MKTFLLTIVVGLSAALADGAGPVASIMQFHAAWCGPCRRMQPIVDELRQSGLAIRPIDIDAEQALAQRYGVRTIPCFVAVDADGNEVERLTGATSAEKLRSLFGKQASAPSPQGPSLVLVSYSVGGKQSLASGTVVDRLAGKASVVLTCAHGYTAVSKIVVSSQDGKQFEGIVMGMDAAEDVCLLLTADMGIRQRPIGSIAPKPGDDVWLAGFAQGKRFQVTRGKVLGFVPPAAGRKETFLKTSCRADPGCSGGCFVDARGYVVGTVTAAETTSGGGPRREESIGPCMPVVLPAIHCETLR
jgi:S1-C subfamily serine protease